MKAVIGSISFVSKWCLSKDDVIELTDKAYKLVSECDVEDLDGKWLTNDYKVEVDDHRFEDNSDEEHEDTICIVNITIYKVERCTKR